MAHHARTPVVESAIAPQAPRAQDLGTSHRGRLFRKYLALILTLVCGALLVSGAITTYFTYQENKSALAGLQHEKAIAAASRIEQYIGTIERQLRFAALPQIDYADIELRRIEFLKLLRQAPEITDIAQIDGAGREQIAVSRLGMDVIGSQRDRSQEPAFRGARRDQTWFGPVYFRKETEPYMTLAVRSGSDNGPVTVADVNLKFIWDVVSRIKIGERGKAYVVDRNGFLVADPDIGLVLRKTNLSDLAHVKTAMNGPPTDELATVSADPAGTTILVSFAAIEPLDWKVFVEQPVAEVYSKLNASIMRTGLLLVAGLIISAFVALMLARGMARPIGTLAEGAQRIGAGELDQKIIVRTGDELEGLADQFNRMSGQLRDSYASLERKVDERTHELKNSLDQQTAITEILRVISSSPTDVQPVMDAVAERAAHLCDAPFARIMLVDGEMLSAVAQYSAEAIHVTTVPIPLKRSSITGRAVLDQETIHYADVADVVDDEFPDARENVTRWRMHAALAVPLMSERGAYGAIFLFRQEAGLFSPDQVALVQTFARQAAIAIDNVRLFNETKSSLEQQTAISEILRVISSSPTDVQPVLEAVAQRAAHLCDAPFAYVVLAEDGKMRPVATYTMDRGLAPYEDPALMTGPFDVKRGYVIGRAITDGETIHHADIVPLLDAEYPDARENQGRFGFRAVLAVPLMRERGAYGGILIWRREPRPFSQDQIALVTTFARQAAIAIDNVRLFNETKEALEQQTAIAEILRVISSSPTDVQPVLDAIAERAARLCDASAASMYLTDGEMLRHLASKGPSPDPVSSVEALPINRDSVSGRALLERRLVEVRDMLDVGDEYPLSYELAQRHGHRTVVVTPLFREGKPFGTILLRRQEVRPFSDREIGLLRTFGDQAAIALENVRLFNETKEALDQQRASGEVLAAISSSIADTTPVFEKILTSCERLFAGNMVGINLVGDDGLVRLGAYHGLGRAELEKILDAGTGTGSAIRDRRIVHFADVEHDEGASEKTRRACKAIGVRSVVFAPMLWEGKGIGVIFVGRDSIGPFSDKEIALLKTFADQAVIAIQNARLFREIQEKSRQLEVANKHKSDFLASMSHELRTPLNAIIGFSEVLIERLFGDVNAKQDDYLKDIHSSGTHLLALINDILDLSKVEAGRMELDLSQFDLPAVIGGAMSLVRERALQHAITMRLDIDSRLGPWVGDERKVKQIMLNLLSNAVKFTPDGGHVDVKAALDGYGAVVSVRDTGIGIAPQDQAAVFEEFRQVGSDYARKSEGTGLGLALARKFIELHGGRIWVESTPGIGSVFTFTLPNRA